MQQDELKVIVFELGNEEYAVPVDNVKSIEKLLHITRVPNTASFVKGVINLRGIVTPILDLRNRLNLPEKEYDDNTRIIITTVDDIEVGMIVDSANDVVNVDREKIEPKPEVITFQTEEHIKGVVKHNQRLFILLDLKSILEEYDLKDC